MMIQHFCTDNWDFTNHKKSQEWNQQKLARSLNTSYYIFLLFASKMRGFFIPELSIIWLYVHIASTAPFLMLKSPLDHVSAPWDGDHITTEHRITLQLCKMPWQKACHSARQFFQISPIISNQSDSIMSMCIVKYLQSPPIIISIIISYPNLGVTWCPPCTSSTTLPSAQIVTVPSAFCKCLEWSPRRLSLFRSHHFGGLIYINY